MAEHDVTRELVRRAYADELIDVDAGLDEVVRRAGRPAVTVQPRHAVNLKRRRRLALAGVFAAVAGLILVVGLSSGRLGGGEQVGLPPQASSTAHPTPSSGNLGSVGPAPVGLPSSCASAWKLEFATGAFAVTPDSQSACPPVDPQRVWLMDTGEGNGLVYPGAATIWPTVTTGTAITPPFTFTVPSIPALVEGHFYQLIYLPPGITPTAGQDATEPFKQSLIISWTVPQAERLNSSRSPLLHSS